MADEIQGVVKDVGQLKVAVFGRMADDGVTFQDGLVQTAGRLSSAIESMKNDRKWIFALLGLTSVATSASAAHQYGLWGLLSKLFGG